MNTIRKLLVAAALAAVAFSTAACGKTVEPGNAGAFIRTFGSNAGVDPVAKPTGWHMTGIGERIEQYPTITRTYAYTRAADDRGNENEEIVFTDKNGQVMTADISVTLAADPAAIPKLYQTYRLDFDHLLDGPIRNDVRTFVAAETELVGVEALLAGGRQAVLQRAFAKLKAKWGAHGIVISQLNWIGPINFPDIVTASIRARTKADQDVMASQAGVAVAEADGRRRVAIAEADAKVNALRSNTITAQLLQQQAIAKWDGHLPTVTGSGAVPFVNIPRE